MIFSRIFCNLYANLTISVALAAIVGDYLVKLSNSPFLKALCDNITHAIIGGLSWSICYINLYKTSGTQGGFLEILTCTIISSIIDLDHFIAAKSIRLKDATRLIHRPLLHCSTVPLMLFLFLLLINYVLEYPFVKKTALIMLTAFTTHHLRDANRRGLWFYPYGSTAPIPYVLYIILICMTSYVIIFIDRLFKNYRNNSSSDYFHVV